MTNDKKKPVTDDELYRHSSQFRLWSFTKEGFAKRQRETYEKGRVETMKKLESKGITDFEPLTYEEERQLVRFYASKIGDIAGSFNMPSQVKATATSYFLKFYLVNSALDYHPKNIMYTCVFLASKSENCFVAIKDFCQPIKKLEPQDVLELEYVVLQSLLFTLSVHNGLKPLHGFFLDIQSVLEKTTAELGSLHDKARHLLLKSFVSNAQFFYTPPQMALASLMTDGEEIVTSYLATKYDQEHCAAILAILRECLAELRDHEVCSSEQSRKIDKNLHSCLNPDKHLLGAKRKAEDGGGTEPDAKRLKVESAVDSPASGVPSAASSAPGSVPPMDPNQQEQGS